MISTFKKLVPQFVLAEHNDRLRTHMVQSPVSEDASTMTFSGAEWRISLAVEELSAEVQACRFEARVVSGRAVGIAAGIQWVDSEWSNKNYVLIPGAVYAGNRFSSKRRPYPPVIRDIGQCADRMVFDIGDIPRLSEEAGPSHLDQTSLDAAVPGLGVWRSSSRSAFILLTPQNSSHGACGFEVVENTARDMAEILLLAPGFLHPIPGDDDEMSGIGNTAVGYRHPQNADPAILEAGQSLQMHFHIHQFSCDSVQGVFERFFEHRKTMFPGADLPAPDLMPFSAVWDRLLAKHNKENWDEKFGLYRVGIPWLPKQYSQFWQTGWCGGGIPLYPILQDGDVSSQARARSNLHFLLTNATAGTGLFKSIMADDGSWKGDGDEGWDEPWSLVRRQADALYFATRQCQLLLDRGERLPEVWTQALRQAASALCDIWDRHGEYGFMVNYDTGELMIRSSTSGALLPAALILAERFFGETRFLTVAQAAAENYRTRDLVWGVTTGGPGDALQAPDSESIFALIESFILLHEETGEIKWLTAARDACAQAASWVLSYPYEFPSTSSFARMGMDSRGAIIANAQNKCGVPGICTLSGQGLLRVFRSTGDLRLLQLLKEISHALPQYLSTEERPLPTNITWGHPMSHLPAGWMCERVNITPSWNEPIGEQAAYSCWCEVAMMLTWSDIPGIYAQPDSGVLVALDHVQAEWVNSERTRIRIRNTTAYPAGVKVFVETSSVARSRKLEINFASRLPQVFVPAGGVVELEIPANPADS